MTHVLKTWPEYFQAVRDGRKRFEVRKSDRDFSVGDLLVLVEWDPQTGQTTNETERRHVTYLLPGGQFGIEAGFVVLGIE